MSSHGQMRSASADLIDTSRSVDARRWPSPVSRVTAQTGESRRVQGELCSEWRLRCHALLPLYCELGAMTCLLSRSCSRYSPNPIYHQHQLRHDLRKSRTEPATAAADVCRFFAPLLHASCSPQRHSSNIFLFRPSAFPVRVSCLRLLLPSQSMSSSRLPTRLQLGKQLAFRELGAAHHHFFPRMPVVIDDASVHMQPRQDRHSFAQG